jgi:hypothetical protein
MFDVELHIVKFDLITSFKQLFLITHLIMYSNVNLHVSTIYQC